MIKQKEYERKNKMINTGIMDRKQLGNLISRVRQADDDVGKLFRGYGNEASIQRPVGTWPKEWVDFVHEEHGGRDERGVRPQQGIEILRGQMQALYMKNGIMTATDDVNDVDLDAGMVQQAREEEMSFFKKLGVYTRVKRSEMVSNPGKMISTKCIDTNKGDRENPNYRSRLVGREFMSDTMIYFMHPHRRWRRCD